MTEREQTVSALLPVHAGVDVHHLKAALRSIVQQTKPADEVIVVEDGPLPEAHRALLDEFELVQKSVIRLTLPVNQGAGVANQVGLQAASSEWIAKVDADDISVEGRFEAQLNALARTGADLCGSAMLEFDGDPIKVTARRDAPLDHVAIARRMRSNNPINHPTAMYRRDAAIDSGGYPHLRLMQDYVLFARMLASGARMTNVREPLVFFRAGDELQRRRSGPGFAQLEWQLQQELRMLGVVGHVRARVNFLCRMAYRRMPAGAARWIHGHVLSRPIPTRGRGR